MDQIAVIAHEDGAEKIIQTLHLPLKTDDGAEQATLIYREPSLSQIRKIDEAFNERGALAGRLAAIAAMSGVAEDELLKGLHRRDWETAGAIVDRLFFGIATEGDAKKNS
ncbi:hypothetical protein [Polycladidibacter hongkongensis]|uniref:hypothetical protein n=1 Tax=Polycladidibacter hongkongensis TaxID=1647556 RepID=UPI00082EC293|nr:hypothetical protein [Pseudovibrio hongkongensis]